MKRLLPVLLLLLILPFTAHAQSLEESIDQVLNTLPLGEIQSTLTDAFGTPFDLQDTLSRLAKGEMVWDAQALLQQLLQKLLTALSGSVWRFARLLAPAVLCGVVANMRTSFAKAALGDVLHSACFLLLAGVMAQDVASHMALAQNAINSMADMMQNLFPMLLTLLAAVGGTASTAFFQPAVVAASGTMTTLMRTVTMRFALGAAVLTILNHLSEHIRIGQLASLLRTIATWTLGVSFTVFISVTTLQGLGAAAADGISIRTAKYAVDNFVPVVGGMFADTMDTLVGCSLLIKNALGITGLVALLFVAATPLIQSMTGVLVYRISAALLEPVAEKRISACIRDFSDALTLMFVIQLSMCAMFLLLIAQLLVVGNLTVMLR